MSIRNLYFLIFIALLGTACSSDVFLVHNGNMPSPEKVAQISEGQTYEQVEEILGSPSLVSTLDSNTWIYMSATFKKVAFFEPEELERKILSISFDNEGKVAKISNYDKEDGKQIEISEQQTPTQGHNIGFFQKYFGGVGSYMPISGTDSENSL